jgi:hypothetical protein
MIEKRKQERPPAPARSSATSRRTQAPEATGAPATRPRGVWGARLLLAAYVALLCYLMVQERRLLQGADISLWEMQDTGYLLGRLAWIVAKPPVVLAAFIPVGALCVVAAGRRVSLLVLLVAAAAGVLAAGLVRGFDGGQPWRLPPPDFLIAPSLGLILGLWIGASWRRGRKAFRRTMTAMAVCAFLLLAAGGALFFAMLDDEPLAIEKADVTSKDKRRLVDLVRQRERFERDGAAMERIELSEHDVNQLIAWGLSLGVKRRRAVVDLESGVVSLKASVAVPWKKSPRRFLNVFAAAATEVRGGRLTLDIRRLDVGSIAAPRPVQKLCSWLIASTVREDYHARQLVAAVSLAEIEPAKVTIELERSALSKELVSGITRRIGVEADVAEAASVYHRRLVTMAPEFPKRDERFIAFMRAAFQLARERSNGGDAVLENRAAILALGVILGHYRLETLTGPISEPELRVRGRSEAGKSTIHGRADWPRHFILSAAVAVLSAEHVSDAVGIFKEEYDSGPRGSGFSFADLLADRAGTTFGLEATKNEASARRVQHYLAGDFDIAILFPSAEGLPEGLSEAELSTLYGGVGGAEYKRIADDIERRLESCELLHPQR